MTSVSFVVARWTAKHPGHDELAARMDNYELAFRMQIVSPLVGLPKFSENRFRFCMFVSMVSKQECKVELRNIIALIARLLAWE